MKPATALPWTISGSWATNSYEGATIGAIDPKHGTYTMVDGEPVLSPNQNDRVCQTIGPYTDGSAQLQAYTVNARYIVHAANNYPRLVQALRSILNSGTCNDDSESCMNADAILRELGESE